MNITEFLDRAAARQLAARTIQRYRHEWSCWTKLDCETLDEFREKALSKGLSPATIESVLSTVTIIHRFYGVETSSGERLSIPLPQPDVPTAEQISRIYAQSHVARWPTRDTDCADWWRCFIVVACWTGFRLVDLERLHWPSGCDRLSNQATKTGKRIDVPVLDFVGRHLERIPGHFSMTRTRVQLYRELRRMAKVAGVPYVSPQAMRRFAIQTWTATDTRAGEIIHGKSLGVLHHYLDAFRHLESVAPQVQVPDCWRTKEERESAKSEEDEIARRYRMAPSSKRKVILSVVREIA